MRIDSIELDGFGPFGHAFIDLSSAHLASVVGGNGNGKSKAFVEAPIFALTGAKTRGSLDDHVMSEPERGHWFYGEWIEDDVREWEPDYDDTDQCHGYVPFYLKDHPGTIDGVQYREIPEGMAL